MKTPRHLWLIIISALLVAIACLMAACGEEEKANVTYELVADDGVYLTLGELYKGVYIRANGADVDRILLTDEGVQVSGLDQTVNGKQTLTVKYGKVFSGTVRVNVAFQPYEVTYAAGQGGRIEGVARQYISYGEASEAVTAVAQEGFAFLNWSDGVTTATRNHTNVGVDADAVLSVWASFARNRYTVTFENAGGDAETRQVAYGNTLGKLPKAQVVAGKTFVRWQDADGNEINESTIVYGPMMISPVYEDIMVHVIFYVYNGMNDLSVYRDYELTYGSYFDEELPEAPARVGKTFVRWQLKGSIDRPDFAQPVTGNMYIEPFYLNKKVSVTIDEANGNTPALSSVNYGATLTRPADPYYAGYDFLGWKAEGAMEYYDFDTPLTADLTIVAEWQPIETVTYVLRIWSARQNGTLVREVEYAENSLLGEPAPLDNNAEYYFAGYVDADGNELLPARPMTSDYDIYATWSNVIYTIRFNVRTVDDISAEDIERVQTVYGRLSVTDLPEPRYTSAKYVFAHWSYQGEAIYDYLTVDGNMTLDAVWELRRYTITFDANDIPYGVSTSLGYDNVEEYEYGSTPKIEIRLLSGVRLSSLKKIYGKDGEEEEDIWHADTKNGDGSTTVTFVSAAVEYNYLIVLKVVYVTYKISFNTPLPLGKGIDGLSVSERSEGVYSRNGLALTEQNKNNYSILAYEGGTIYFDLAVTKGYQLNNIQVGAKSVMPDGNGVFAVEGISANVTVNILTSPEKYSFTWGFVNSQGAAITGDPYMRIYVNNGVNSATQSMTLSYGDDVVFTTFTSDFVDMYDLYINGEKRDWSECNTQNNNGTQFKWNIQDVDENMAIVFVQK